MAELKGRRFEDEFVAILKSLAGDKAGCVEGDAYLSSTNALFHGEPCSWAITPKIFDKRGIKILEDAALTMAKIMDKLTLLYLESESFRSIFNLGDYLNDLIASPTHYECQIPIARVDVFFQEETGDYYFCELNTDGSAGMVDALEVTRAIQNTETYRIFASKHPVISSFDPVRACMDALMDVYHSWKYASAETPTLAIVDYTESACTEEIDGFVDEFNKRGIPCRFVDIHTLRIDRVKGEKRLVDDNGPIDLVWRRAVTGELADKPTDGTLALAEASRQGYACVVGGFRTWPCATKTIFAAMHSQEALEVLTAEERDFIDKHVPLTIMLHPGDDLSRFDKREDWILKPSDGYNAKGVIAGLDCTDAEWQEALVACAQECGIIQKYAPQYFTPCATGGKAGLSEDSNNLPLAANMEGLYLFGGRFGGVYTRCGLGHVIGEQQGRLNMGCLVVEE